MYEAHYPSCYTAVFATAGDAFGHNGHIPWDVKEDMQHFKKYTQDKIIIMGRITYEHLPKKPLPGRINIVLSHDRDIRFAKIAGEAEPHHVFSSIDECDRFLNADKKLRMFERCVIGGAEILEAYTRANLIDRIVHTSINQHVKASVKLPASVRKMILIFRPVSATSLTSRGDVVHIYHRSESSECCLMRVMQEARDGCARQSRAAPTNGVFGRVLRFSLANNKFPLITHRSLPFRWIFEELMWIIRGSTNTKELSRLGVTIWNSNSSRNFLDRNGLSSYNEGDVGPTYGFQMRHYGAEYKGCLADYKGAGIDQLITVIKLLREDPFSRRIIINLYNPADITKMALPPCAFCYQFYVHVNGGTPRLSCMLTQRSSDIALAGGWNVASASLLTILLAQICHMEPHELIWSIGDVHVYNNQKKIMGEVLARHPSFYPKLYVNTARDNIEDIRYEDVQLLNYHPAPAIKIDFNE